MASVQRKRDREAFIVKEPLDVCSTVFYLNQVCVPGQRPVSSSLHCPTFSPPPPHLHPPPLPQCCGDEGFFCSMSSPILCPQPWKHKKKKKKRKRGKWRKKKRRRKRKKRQKRKKKKKKRRRKPRLAPTHPDMVRVLKEPTRICLSSPLLLSLVESRVERSEDGVGRPVPRRSPTRLSPETESASARSDRWERRAEP